MVDIWMVYSTFANRDEAISAAHVLLEKHLIACANVTDGMTAVYRWEGKVQQEKEAVLIAKTSAGKVQQAIDAVKALHSYTVPCIVAWPLAQGHPPFMQWVAEETGGKKLE